MRKLLRADNRRVVIKILPWILMAVSFIIIAFSIALKIDDGTDRSLTYLSLQQNRIFVVTAIIGFAALLGIYGDEFKSMVMIGVIGRGISREKFVLAKFLDLLIYVFQLYIISIAYQLSLLLVFKVHLNSIEVRFLLLSFVTEYLDIVAYVALAALFYFLSESAAIGLFAYLAALIILPGALEFANSMIPSVAKYHLDRYFISGMISSAYSDFMLGDVGRGLLFIFLLIAVYMVGTVALTMFVFNKKELEF